MLDGRDVYPGRKGTVGAFRDPGNEIPWLSKRALARHAPVAQDRRGMERRSLRARRRAHPQEPVRARTSMNGETPRMANPPAAHPALTDELTGLPNRLQFDTVYRYLFAGADRGVALTLMMMEVHAAEPTLIREAGDTLHQVTRSSDLVAHLGEGRFAVLLLGSNLFGARVAADRVASALQASPVASFAIGLAAYRDDMNDPSELMDAVRRAVTEAASLGGGMEIVAG